MKISYLGHTCVLVETAGRRVLCDPWLTDPAYVNSWWHWPPVDVDPRSLDPVDFIYLSHDHPDHFDPKTLVHFRRDTPIVIGNFTERPLSILLRRLGFTDVRPLDFWKPHEVFPGLFALLTPSNHGVWDTHDTSLALWSGDGAVYDGNDCILEDEFAFRLKALAPPLDVALLPFTPNFHYPACFRFPTEADKADVLRRMKQKNLERFARLTEILSPRYVVPFSSPYVLLGDEEFHLNRLRLTTFPTEAVEHLGGGGLDAQAFAMNPLDEFDPARGFRRRAAVAPDYDGFFDSIEKMRAERADEVRALRSAEPRAAEDLGDAFSKYAGRKFEHGLNVGLDARVLLALGGDFSATWLMDFANGSVRFDAADVEDYDVKIEMPSGLMQMIVSSRVHWDDVLFSFRCRFDQRRYLPDLWSVLRHQELEDLEQWRSWELDGAEAR